MHTFSHWDMMPFTSKKFWCKHLVSICNQNLTIILSWGIILTNFQNTSTSPFGTVHSLCFVGTWFNKHFIHLTLVNYKIYYCFTWVQMQMTLWPCETTIHFKTSKIKSFKWTCFYICIFIYINNNSICLTKSPTFREHKPIWIKPMDLSYVSFDDSFMKILLIQWWKWRSSWHFICRSVIV